MRLEYLAVMRKYLLNETLKSSSLCAFTTCYQLIVSFNRTRRTTGDHFNTLDKLCGAKGVSDYFCANRCKILHFNN